MISLIVCSINKGLLEGLKASVAETIGVEHEWLIWDNRKSGKGICEVYNHMAEQAKYPCLCFLHEDLVFKTNGWGKYLLELFSGTDYDLIGIAGSEYKSKIFSGWYSGGGACDYSNIYHRVGNVEYPLSFPEKWPSPERRVVTIDGVFMVCRKQVWESIKFNEGLLKGFHFYDIDFSIRAARLFKVGVTRKIDIIHLTVGGDFGEKWIRDGILFHESSRSLLPFSVSPLNTKKADLLVGKYWLDWLKNFPISFRSRRRWVNCQKLYLVPGLWYSILKFYLYKPLGLQKVHKLITGRLKGK